MSELLCNLDSIISVFNKYAKEEGDCATLTKGELKHLIQNEFAEVMMNPHDPRTTETILQLLDQDHDGEVDFEEFAVLVFKMARACYRPCQVELAEGESSEEEWHATCQDIEAPKEESACRSAQELEENSEDGESQRSSKEQKGKTPKPERCTDGESEEFMVQEDPSRQRPGKPSGACSSQRESDENEILNEGPTHEATRVEEKADQEHGHAAEEACRQSMRKPFTSVQDAREHQGCTTQQSSQACQTEKQGHTGQLEEKSRRTEQEQTTQQSTQEAEQTPKQREINKPQRREQEVADGKSQEETQKPTHRCIQKPQASEEKLTCRSFCYPQEEHASLTNHVERPFSSELSSTHQPQTGEQPSHRQDSKPSIQDQAPKWKAEEELQEEPGHMSSQLTKREREERTQIGQLNHESLATGQGLTGQLECHPQGSEKTLVDQPNKYSRSSECASTIHEHYHPLASKQPKASPGERKPPNPIRLGQSQCHECWPQTPKECPSPQEMAQPPMPRRDLSCDLGKTSVQSPRGSSARQPFKTSQCSKALQFPPPWSPKQ